MPSRVIPYLKAVVHLMCLLPFAYLLNQYRDGELAMLADPVNHITHFTGDWALWLLLATLAVTPVRRLHPALAWMIRFRRMLGLYCFFYATLHLATYVLLFSGYDMAGAIAGLKAGHMMEPLHQLVLIWPTMLEDAEKRRFIQVGLLAWLILLALAVTSPQRVLRAMGGKAWGRLHKLIYAAGFLALTHYWWMGKVGVRTPWKVTVVFWILILWRAGLAVKKRLKTKAMVVA